jgi:hypothetical protein
LNLIKKRIEERINADVNNSEIRLSTSSDKINQKSHDDKNETAVSNTQNQIDSNCKPACESCKASFLLI